MKQKEETDRPWIFLELAALATVGLFVANQFVMGNDFIILKALGATVLLLAAVFMFAPFYYLSKYGRVEAEKSFIYTTEVVDRGVYAFVRHPQYLGYALLNLGFVMLFQSWVTAVAGTLAILFFYLQSIQEERFCSQQMGVDYEGYCERVPRFNFLLGIIRYLNQKRAA